jgi:hypothetical protein
MFEAFHNTISHRSRRIFGNKIRAVVLNNVDPLGTGRIKARCRDIHDQFTDDQIPWSLPKEGFGDGMAGVGKQETPPIGSTIFLEHQDDSLYHPHYSAGPSTQDRKISDLNQDKPGKVDRGGNLESTDHSSGNNIITKQHQSGTITTIGTDGTVTKQNATDKNESTFGMHTIHSKKDLYIKSDGDIHFQAAGKLFVYPPPVSDTKPTPLEGGPAARTKPTFTPPSGTSY